MSKFFDILHEIIDNIVIMLCWCFALYVAYSAWNSDWDLNKFFDKYVKKETWIKVERGLGTYPKVVERGWALSIFNNIDVKSKIRDSITNDNNGKMDFSYEATAKLTHPVLSESSGYDAADYKISFYFKFIDEDGFVIHSILAPWFEPIHTHEEYEQTDLKHDWYDPDNEFAIVKVLLSDKVEEKVAKRTARIIYEPNIVITRRIEKVEEDDDFGFVPFDKPDLFDKFRVKQKE